MSPSIIALYLSLTGTMPQTKLRGRNSPCRGPCDLSRAVEEEKPTGERWPGRAGFLGLGRDRRRCPASVRIPVGFVARTPRLQTLLCLVCFTGSEPLEGPGKRGLNLARHSSGTLGRFLYFGADSSAAGKRPGRRSWAYQPSHRWDSCRKQMARALMKGALLEVPVHPRGSPSAAPGPE